MNSKLIKELLTYNSANRLLITGTPLQNNIAELWSLLHFLLPEVFNDLGSFESWFDFSTVLDNRGNKQVVEKRKRNLISTMHAILKPFLLRRIKTDVESSLPKKREYILYAPLTPEQKELYREIINGTARQYLEDKAAERIETRNGRGSSSRTESLKRNPEPNRAVTQNKSVKSSRASTPGSAAGSNSRARKSRQSYRDISDREFGAKLRRLEMGLEEEEVEESVPSDGELEEIERAKTIKLASMYSRENICWLTSKLTLLCRKGDILQETPKSNHASSSGLRLSTQLLLALGRGFPNRRFSPNHQFREDASPRPPRTLPYVQGPQSPPFLPIQNSTRHPPRLGDAAPFLELLPYRR